MIDYDKIAAGASISATNDLPASGGRGPQELNPFLGLVTEAAKDHRRRDLHGRFSLTPYPGRVGACEFTTVAAKLHGAARSLGVKLSMRKLDPTAEDAGITFKVAK